MEYKQGRIHIRKRLVIEIDSDVIRLAHSKAKLEERPMWIIVEELLRDWIKSGRRKDARGIEG